MGVFAICDFENDVQLLDKTRFDAQKSFAANSYSALTTLTIKPGADGSTIDCFDSTVSERYLDWCFSTFAIDVDSTNNSILFSEGSTEKTGTIASSTYTLSTYATAVAAAMTSAGTQTYTASVADNKVTISAPTTSFQFTDSDGANQCFFTLDVAGLTHTGGLVEYGLRKISIAVGNGTQSNTLSVYQRVFSEDGDRLFCEDGDLMAHEPDIMKWVTEGRASFKNVYRRSQKLIISWLDKEGYVDVYQKKYDKHDIIDLEEVKQWSTFMSLRLIFQGLSNAVDDVFDRKSREYLSQENSARQRAVLRLDVDGDGEADVGESLSISSGSLFRR